MADLDRQVHELADRLGPDATWDDVIEEARFRKAVKEGVAAANRGEFAAEEDVRRAFAKWGVDVAAVPGSSRARGIGTCNARPI